MSVIVDRLAVQKMLIWVSFGKQGDHVSHSEIRPLMPRFSFHFSLCFIEDIFRICYWHSHTYSPVASSTFPLSYIATKCIMIDLVADCQAVEPAAALQMNLTSSLGSTFLDLFFTPTKQRLTESCTDFWSSCRTICLASLSSCAFSTSKSITGTSVHSKPLAGCYYQPVWPFLFWSVMFPHSSLVLNCFLGWRPNKDNY